MITWQFSTHTEKNKTWYLIALIVGLSLIAYGVVNQIYMMSVVVFLFIGVYLLYENNSDPITGVEITDRGILVGGTFYDYSRIRSFAILYEAQIPRLLRCSLSKGMIATIDIPLTEMVDPVELRAFLSQYLGEDEHAEFTRSDRLIQAMKL